MCKMQQSGRQAFKLQESKCDGTVNKMHFFEIHLKVLV